MARAATARLKVNPLLGLRPSLENHRIGDLNVDPAYQRSIEGGQSKSLIRKIAMFWDWALFHPLSVARRADGSLWVIDGQHRLAAARLRRDLYDLPCVVGPSRSLADEAASFVAMNIQRRAMTKLDLFKAAVAGENAWRRHGAPVTRTALRALGEALGGQVLRYAGTIFPGIAAVCAAQMAGRAAFDPALWPLFIEMIGEGEQARWRQDVMQLRTDYPNVRFSAASEAVFVAAWADLLQAFAGDE